MRKKAFACIFLWVLTPLLAHAESREHQRKPSRWKSTRPVFAPGVRFVEPSFKVAVACRECSGAIADVPQEVVALGLRLRQAGFEPVLMESPPAKKNQFVAIVSDLEGPGFIQLPRSKEEVDETIARIEKKVCPRQGPTRPVRHLFVVHERTGYSRALFAQATWVAYYAKLDADFIRADNLSRVASCWLNGYASIILAAEFWPDLSRMLLPLEHFVRNGGGLVALARIDDPSVYPLFGVRQFGSREEIVEEIRCENEFMPGAGKLGFRFGREWGLLVPEVFLAQGGQVLCWAKTSSGNVVPSTWLSQLGNGRTLMWISGEVGDKSARGRMLMSLLKVALPSAAAQMDALVFFIDDCPMPMAGRKVPPLDALYGVTDAEFYQKRWWPDIMALLKKFDVKATFAFVASYDAKVEPPFASHFSEDEEDEGVRASVALAKAVKESGHEIGLHGYNHQSLTTGTEGAWRGLGPMMEALSVARAEMLRLFGEDGLPRTYIAPNNFVHALGKEAVTKVFPEIAAIAGQYLDEGAIMGQEFGPDPDFAFLVNTPRISSESFLDSENAAEVLDALVLPGVFSHFIHPDDILDPLRSRGLSWEGLRDGLHAMLDFLRLEYPFLRSMGASEFAEIVKAWQGVRLEVTKGEKSLLLSARLPHRGRLTVFVSLPPRIQVSVTGDCEAVFHVPSEGRLYMRIGEGPCTVRWQ